MIKWLSFFFVYSFLWMGPPAPAQEKPEEKHVIYVSSISWHTGIVVPGYSFPDSVLREDLHYSDNSYLEIGWGDADYFTHDSFNLWYAFKAVFWPTSSVLHLNPIPRKAEDYYFDTDVVSIELNDDQLRSLILYLVGEFDLDETGKIIPVAEGLYPDSYFFKGSSSYYFPNNSNVWAARAIKNAGFSISPLWHLTTGCVLNKVEEYGELIVEED